MSQFEKEDSKSAEPEYKEQDPEPVSDEEFEKKQKKDNAIIKTVIDGVLTFFQ